MNSRRRSSCFKFLALCGEKRVRHCTSKLDCFWDWQLRIFPQYSPEVISWAYPSKSFKYLGWNWANIGSSKLAQDPGNFSQEELPSRVRVRCQNRSRGSELEEVVRFAPPYVLRDLSGADLSRIINTAWPSLTQHQPSWMPPSPRRIVLGLSERDRIIRQRIAPMRHAKSKRGASIEGQAILSLFRLFRFPLCFYHRRHLRSEPRHDQSTRGFYRLTLKLSILFLVDLFKKTELTCLCLNSYFRLMQYRTSDLEWSSLILEKGPIVASVTNIYHDLRKKPF